MKPISEKEFHKTAKKQFDSVFATEDPYRTPFQSQIKLKLLLYGYSYGLCSDEPWLTPIIAAMSELRETGFYLTLLGKPGPEPWHWFVPIEEAGLFINTTYPRECAIYSLTGQWGIIGSDENHAVAGGVDVFIKTIKNSVFDWDERLGMFIKYWTTVNEQNPKIRIDWLPALLTHVYGESDAKEILHGKGLSWLINSSLGKT